MLTSGVRQQIAHRGHPTLLVNVSRPHKRTQSNELQFQSLILNLEHLREELSLRCPDIRGGPLTWKTETKTNKQKKITQRKQTIKRELNFNTSISTLRKKYYPCAPRKWCYIKKDSESKQSSWRLKIAETRYFSIKVGRSS